MKKIIYTLLATSIAGLYPAGVNATMTYNLQNNKLVSVSDLVIDNNIYNVSFVDGTCAQIFNGCTGSSSFGFAKIDDAWNAIKILNYRVLLSKIPVDGKMYDFNSSMIAGLDKNGGDVMIPFAVTGSNANMYYTRNGYISNYTYSLTKDSGTDPFSVWAKFSLTGTVSAPPTTSAIPEPTTWALMLAGFGLTGAAMRRRRRVATAFA